MEGNPWPRRVIGIGSPFALGILGNLASDALKTSYPLIAALIWPVVIVGVIVIAVAVVLSERPRATPKILSGSQSPTDEQRELAKLKAAERAKWRLSRLEGHLGAANASIARYSADDLNMTLETKTDAYGQIAALDRAVGETLADAPEDLARYRAPDQIVWSGLLWHEQVVAMMKIRRERIGDLVYRLRQHP